MGVESASHDSRTGHNGVGYGDGRASYADWFRAIPYMGGIQRAGYPQSKDSRRRGEAV